ncbi:hypothetical protein MNBD_DELTA04-1596 [hydrothermal vent metagenome]|uniref:Uncharacterized protein n=1 Tax=hydrothermal vent metagenome TaxID=652676 RepID=A0A3B0VBP7_9ZZZZ
MQIASLRDLRGGNDVIILVISTSYQRSSCAIIGRTAGRRGAEYKMHVFVSNAINSTYCLEYYLKPSRIQVFCQASNRYAL